MKSEQEVRDAAQIMTELQQSLEDQNTLSLKGNEDSQGQYANELNVLRAMEAFADFVLNPRLGIKEMLARFGIGIDID